MSKNINLNLKLEINNATSDEDLDFVTKLLKKYFNGENIPEEYSGKEKGKNVSWRFLKTSKISQKKEEAVAPKPTKAVTVTRTSLGLSSEDLEYLGL